MLGQEIILDDVKEETGDELLSLRMMELVSDKIFERGAANVRLMLLQEDQAFHKKKDFLILVHSCLLAAYEDSI